MLVRYSIVELLMVFEVSAQREHTIVYCTYLTPYVYLVCYFYLTCCVRTCLPSVTYVTNYIVAILLAVLCIVFDYLVSYAFCSEVITVVRKARETILTLYSRLHMIVLC